MTSMMTMGYVLKAKSGEVLVVDGGAPGNGEELQRVIQKAGGHVHLWLITHPHDDHHDAVIEVLKKDPCPVTYDRLGATDLPDTWPGDRPPFANLVTWNRFARTLDQRYFYIKKGQHFQLGSMYVEVLADANPEITVNPVNNQSCVFRITEDGFTFLMLGDLGIEAGEKLLSYGYDLKSDAVQMAHHGQQGVEENVYQAIAPKYAFWPTPTWLWENQKYLGGGEPGCGPFTTKKTIAWMEKLGTENITSFEHTIVFDTETKTTERY